MSAASAEPTEEEIKAYEEQLARITSAEIVLQAAASLLNVGGHRLGLSQGGEQHRDLEQVRDSIDGVRALLPVIERRMSAAQARPLRDALSQLQMAYAQMVQSSAAAATTTTTTTQAGQQDAAAPGEGAEAPGGAAAPSAGAPDGAAAPSPGASDAGGEQAQGARGGGEPQPAEGSQAPPSQGRQPGPAESSGRLWVPGR